MLYPSGTPRKPADAILATLERMRAGCCKGEGRPRGLRADRCAKLGQALGWPDRDERGGSMTEQPEQSNVARAGEYSAQQRESERGEAIARREADRAVAHQRQLGVSWLAFKAGFFGAFGVAL